MVLIKKNVLSASIATVLLGSTGAFAANDRGFTSDTDWSEEQAGFNGHVGTTFEYETKSTDNYLGKTVKEYTKTHEISRPISANLIGNLQQSMALSLSIAGKKKKAITKMKQVCKTIYH
ncbi:hypothetical protein NLM80_08830 [Escherichia coli]|nr:hypothetical protein [Escherichia coli]MCP3508108.1 hypothetical protein [Escherichia coli]